MVSVSLENKSIFVQNEIQVHFPFLRAETLRLHPPFGTVARKCTKDYKINDTNIVIAEGTSIIIPVAAIHRDPKYFPDPNEFRPERFEDDGINKSFREMPYIPFGDGPRICIGLRLAKLQVKIGLVLLLKKFFFELDEQQTVKMLQINPRSITKMPIGGINLKAYAR